LFDAQAFQARAAADPTLADNEEVPVESEDAPADPVATEEPVEATTASAEQVPDVASADDVAPTSVVEPLGMSDELAATPAAEATDSSEEEDAVAPASPAAVAAVATGPTHGYAPDAAKYDVFRCFHRVETCDILTLPEGLAGTIQSIRLVGLRARLSHTKP
jgi:hypothetical protein